MGKSKIEWTDSSWNPLAGCTKASAGCENCYALRMSRRQEGIGLCERYKGTTTQKGGKLAWTGEVHFDEQELLKPLSWKKPRLIFVCSMSDLWHEKVDEQDRKDILHICDQCPQHTFIFLTKRPRIMQAHFASTGETIPPNWWLGVSVENQKCADDRIPVLCEIPARVRFVSLEPLLEEVSLHNYLVKYKTLNRTDIPPGMPTLHKWILNTERIPNSISWCIVGGESGPGARPMHPEWARRIRDDCKAAGVPYFHKQNGAWQECSSSGWYTPQELDRQIQVGNCRMMRVGKKAAGHLLDGREIHEWPGGEDG